MASTYLSLHYHVVFAVKNRISMIAEEWQSRLHEYLGGTIRGLGGFPQEIGGVADHVHILMGLKATHCLADMMREMKKASSAWAHQEINCQGFAWQEGYAAFTVSASARERVCKYIAHQKEHHNKQSSQVELIELLTMAGVNYDPKYFE
jgi:putative transposase